MMPESCKTCRERLALLVPPPATDGERGLTAAQRADCEAHLASCADCRRELALYRSIAGTLSAFGIEQAPAGLRSRVREAIGSEPAPRRNPLASLFAGRRSVWAGGLVMAALACMIIEIRMPRRDRVATELPQDVPAVSPTSAPPNKPAASGRPASELPRISPKKGAGQTARNLNGAGTNAPPVAPPETPHASGKAAPSADTLPSPLPRMSTAPTADTSRTSPPAQLHAARPAEAPRPTSEPEPSLRAPAIAPMLKSRDVPTHPVPSTMGGGSAPPSFAASRPGPEGPRGPEGPEGVTSPEVSADKAMPAARTAPQTADGNLAGDDLQNVPAPQAAAPARAIPDGSANRSAPPMRAKTMAPQSPFAARQSAPMPPNALAERSRPTSRLHRFRAQGQAESENTEQKQTVSLQITPGVADNDAHLVVTLPPSLSFADGTTSPKEIWSGAVAAHRPVDVRVEVLGAQPGKWRLTAKLSSASGAVLGTCDIEVTIAATARSDS